MFFNRFGKHASLAHQSSRTSSWSHKETPLTSKSSDGSDGIYRRRAVALAMAVQIALPVGMLSRTTSVHAADPVNTPTAAPVASKGDASRADASRADASRADSSRADASFKKLFGTTRETLPHLSVATGPAADFYNAGLDQIRASQYEDAVTTLEKVPVDQLNDQDSQAVDLLVAKTREAAREQRSARASLTIGQEAAARQQWDEATLRLNKVMVNGFADNRTYASAAKELAQVRASSAQAVMQPIHADIPAGTAIAQAMQTDPTMTPATAPVATTEPAAPVATAPVAVAPVAPPAVVAAPVAPAPPAPVASSPEEIAAQQALDTAAKFKQIQLEKNSYEAQKLVEKGRTEQNSGQLSEALKDFGAAGKLDPSNEQARAGFGEVQGLLGLGGGADANTRQNNDIKIKIEEINYRFNAAIDRANTDIDGKKYTDAQHDIEQANIAARTDPTLFPQSQLNQFDATIEQTQVKLNSAKAGSESADLQKASQDALATVGERERQFQKDKERTVAGLIQDARQFTEEGKYHEALAVIENIEKIDPTNAYANGVQQLIQDKDNEKTQAQYRQQFNVELTKQLNRSEEDKIPYNDIVRYSPDWPQISEMRDNEVKADRGDNEDDAALQAQLDRHLPELRFNANSLTDVIDFLRDVTGTNIYVDWPALERASIARDAPVTARLRDIKFSKALELIFKSVEGEDDDHKLGYTLDDGVITISTRKELNKNTVTRRYDINDLLFVAPDYNDAPNLSLQNASQGQSAGGGAGGGGGGQSQSLFQTQGNGQEQQAQAGQREARIDEIKKYITDNVDTNTWKDNGGDVGSISSSPLRAVLLITQTAASHKKIQSVLDSLRASQALQVSIETRFLTVQRNYLEDIGVNADFEFNPLKDPSNARSGVNSSRFTPISVIQNQVTDNTTYRDANGNSVSNSQQGSRQLDWISNVGNAAVPGSIPSDPADYPNPMVISGSYVDNFTVSFLIRAVQANQNTTSLTAPRLTLFSGQRAVLVVQTQQAYVGGLTPVVAQGAALFDPQVQTTTAEGVVLNVQATVSPDRKYVFLDLRPQLARLRALVPFSISAVVTPVTGVLTTAAPQIVQGTLQLPTIDVTIVETSVSVPDGATLLLGGQTLAAETTREQGVPVLSKIPFLKRLFTNRATSQDEQILLILVKPTILIQHESEIKQFPQLSTKLNS